MDKPALSQNQREAILAELATITSIERGSLSEEYREVPAPGGKGTIRKGPYYKHQCWENKRNRSKRVSAHEVPFLREDLQNGLRFNQLIEDLAQLAIANGRQRRLPQCQSGAQLDAKKNFKRKSSRKDTAKPRLSSAKSPRASKRKGSKN